MVHKKYIKKNGKSYGPYYYENYRKNGVTKTRYFKRSEVEKNLKKERPFWHVLLLLFFVFLLGIFLTNNSPLTGHAVLSVQNFSSQKVFLEGGLNLNLQQEEFIPSSTKVVVNNSGLEKEYSLEEFLGLAPEEGNFSFSGANLSGEGLGYGGEEEIYPKISFTLEVLTDAVSQAVEVPASNEGVSSGVTPEKEVVSEENVTEELNQTSEIQEEGNSSEVIQNESILVNLEENQSSQGNETGGEVSSEVVQNGSTEFVQNESSNISLQKGSLKNLKNEVSPENSSPEEVSPAEVPAVEENSTPTQETSSLEEVSTNNSEITGEAIGIFESSLGFLSNLKNVGLAIFPFSDSGNQTIEEVQGKVSYNESFEYNLGNSKGVRMKVGSVSIGGKPVSDNLVSLGVKGNKAVVSTNYTEKKGKSFLVDLKKLKLDSVEGILNISFVYGNKTILSFSKNVTEGRINVTELNESVLSDLVQNVTVKQYKAIIGKPVKSIKILKVSNETNLSVSIPKSSTNITVVIGEEVNQSLKELENSTKAEEENRAEVKSKKVTGLVSLNSLSESPFADFFRRIFNGKITARVIQGEEIKKNIIENSKEKIVNLENVSGIDLVDEVGVEYYTEPPSSVEEKKANGKKVTISAPDELNYTEVLAYTVLEKPLPVNDSWKLRMYWEGNKSLLLGLNYSSEDVVSLENSSEIVRVKIPFEVYDLDEDEFIDYVEWVVPHLSNQNYEVVYVSEAEHLDTNRNFISDISSELSAKDSVYSERIGDGEYLRVTLNRKVDKTDILRIVTRNESLNNSSVEVYAVDDNKLAATFENISNGDYNITLDNLKGKQNILDLKVVGNLSFDYVGDSFCSCPGLNNDWEINLGDNCVVTTSCNIGSGKLSFVGQGKVTCNAQITTSDLGDPGTNGTLEVGPQCLINVV